jgi:hypothetical protein
VNKNDKDLLSCAKAGNEYGVIDATVDGVKVKIYKDIEYNLTSLTYTYPPTTFIMLKQAHTEL